MTKNKNIDLIKNMAKTFEPTEEEHKDFANRLNNIVNKEKKIKITIVTKPKPKKNIDEIADNLGRKLRQGETISKQEHNEFYKSMKQHLQNLKK